MSVVTRSNRHFRQHHRFLEEAAEPHLIARLLVLFRYFPLDAGYEEIDWYYPKGQSGMYYSFFSAQAHSITVPDQRVPLIIWLQGGPGGSSQFGAFTELGPIRITNRTYQSPYSWNILGHTIFIDQPLTVGFSYVRNKDIPLVSSADQAADHLINFLYNLYKQWPALKKSPLYITG